MRQHGQHPERDDNDETQGIAYIIKDLSQSASEDKETIDSAFTTMTTIIKSFQDKIEATKKVALRKRNNKNKNCCWIHGRTRNNNHTTLYVTTKGLVIKMMQLFPISQVDQTSVVTITDKWGVL